MAILTNKGQTLWQEAIQVIPGGNGLLSKRPDRYAPTIWPTYYQKAKGVHIWDLDGNNYIDMAQMGIGTAILGYSDPDVNKAVTTAIQQGINTTLNTPLEVTLAKRLLQLNPFAQSVKFARSGGEAMAIAIRIARTYSGKDKIAFSGYHGWSDWYLATNLQSKEALSDHLLPGLTPAGVPKGLSNTIFPFPYNNINALNTLLKKHPDIGTIVIEGARHDQPSPAFLEALRQCAKEKGIVIILDEITSGWRITDGGAYKTYNFEPDIVVYGKALGNGFAISAIVGRKEIMDAAQDTFISSTFWTESVGFAAGIATLEKLTQHHVWEHLIVIGTEIGKEWNNLATTHNLKLTVSSFKPLITFKLDYHEHNAALLTLFTQEMLKKGYLAANS